MLGLLAVLGAGVGYAVISGIPLEDLYFGALWDELIAGKRPHSISSSRPTSPTAKLSDGVLDRGRLPKVDAFLAATVGVATFFVSLKRVGRGDPEVSIRTRWYDEAGVERWVVRTLHRERHPGGGVPETWAVHEVPRGERSG